MPLLKPGSKVVRNFYHDKYLDDYNRTLSINFGQGTKYIFCPFNYIYLYNIFIL